LTPKKKDTHSKLLGRPFQSPAGPDAVRTPAFKLIGSLSVDITTLQRRQWIVKRTSALTPLEGDATFKIQCSAEGGVEHSGFLTFFEDVSGLGAWHRRWCKLTATKLSYWLYPEDEQTKVSFFLVLFVCYLSSYLRDLYFINLCRNLQGTFR